MSTRLRLFLFSLATSGVACAPSSPGDLLNAQFNATAREQKLSTVAMKLKLNQQGVTAMFDDTQGCIETSAFVIANEDATRLVPEPVTRSGGIFVAVSQFDLCQNEPIINAVGFSEDPGGIAFGPNL